MNYLTGLKCSLILGSVVFLMCFLMACEAPFSDRVCTLIGCDSSYELAFNAENDSLSIGTYSVVLTPETGEPLSCSFRLYDIGAACESTGCISNRDCQGLRGVYHSAQESKILLIYPQLAGELRISISQDDKELANLLDLPTYSKSEPNGPDCGPTCFNASKEIRLER